ncbi:MAG: hypothetical protein WC830_10160 [Burkholderiales bacterium]|jgi:hypothetical protein
MFGLDTLISAIGGPASALNVASTLFNIWGGNQQARQQGAMYGYMAEKDRQQAALLEGTAQVSADKLRLQGKRDASAINAQYGASGVDPTSGSAAVVQGELSRRVELDALNTMLQGKYQAYGQRVQAAEADAAATNARNSSVWNTGKSLLGGLSKEAELSKWGKPKYYGGGYGGSQWSDGQ